MKKKVYQLTLEEKKRITEDLTSLINNREEVVFAYAHGSFTEDIPFHDIDIGVYVAEIGQEESSSYALELSHILSKVTKIQTDVRVMNFAPVSFLLTKPGLSITANILILLMLQTLVRSRCYLKTMFVVSPA